MAGKKKTGGTAKAEDKKNAGLPKSVGGIKLPKGVRNKLSDLAKHPVVADLLAAGLVAIANRLKNEPKVQKGAAKVADTAGDAADQVVEAVSNAAAAVVKPAAKRTRKPAAPASAEAKPAARRTRKPASETPAPSPSPTPAPAPSSRARKPAAADAAAKPPARRTRKTAESSTAKPRAARRATPKKPTPPKGD